MSTDDESLPTDEALKSFRVSNAYLAERVKELEAEAIRLRDKLDDSRKIRDTYYDTQQLMIDRVKELESALKSAEEYNELKSKEYAEQHTYTEELQHWYVMQIHHLSSLVSTLELEVAGKADSVELGGFKIASKIVEPEK